MDGYSLPPPPLRRSLSRGSPGKMRALCSRTHCMCMMFPSAVVYASASHSAMHTPVDVTGIEPARGLCLQGLGLSTFDTHPTILFWLGNRRPSGGRTDALCWPGASGSRGARPEPPINAGVTTRVPCSQGSFRYPRRYCRRAGRRYPKLVRFRYSQGNFRYPGTLRIWR